LREWCDENALHCARNHHYNHRRRGRRIIFAGATILSSPAAEIYRVAGIVMNTQAGMPAPGDGEEDGFHTDAASLNTGEDGRPGSLRSVRRPRLA
jgi:hypothetical protein